MHSQAKTPIVVYCACGKGERGGKVSSNHWLTCVNLDKREPVRLGLGIAPENVNVIINPTPPSPASIVQKTKWKRK